MKQRRRMWKGLFALFSAVVVGLGTNSCGGGGGGGARPTLTLRDDSGRIVSEINEETRPTILSEISGLPPNKQCEVQLYRDGQPLYKNANGNPQPMTLTTTPDGKIPTTVLFYDLGVNPETGEPVSAAGRYEIHVRYDGTQKVFSFTVTRGRKRQVGPPTIWAIREDGRFYTGSVPVGQPVYVKGSNFPPNRRVRLHVVRDKRGWRSGDSLQDVTGTVEEVTTDANGELPQTLVWSSAQVVNGSRDFDIVADVADQNGNFDGQYTSGTDAVYANLITGFTVQEPPTPPPPHTVDLASDLNGNYHSSFTPNEVVSIWVNPPWRPLTPYMMVKKYICVHKDNWQFGDRLEDVTGRPEWDLVRYACSNQYVTPVWNPPLTPGRYDPVIDVNQNGVYDQGDIVGKPFEVQGVGFTIDLNPTELSIQPGGSGTATLTITPLGGFSGTVNLTLQNAPQGVSLSPSSVNVPGPNPVSQQVTISVASNVASGTYNLILRATSGSIRVDRALTLIVGGIAIATPGEVVGSISQLGDFASGFFAPLTALQNLAGFGVTLPPIFLPPSFAIPPVVENCPDVTLSGNTTDADNDGIPVNATANGRCQFTVDAWTVTIRLENVSVQDPNDNDPAAGIRVTGTVIEEWNSPQGSGSLTWQANPYSIRRGPNGSYQFALAGSWQISVTSPVSGSVTFKYNLNGTWTPNPPNDLFADDGTLSFTGSYTWSGDGCQVTLSAQTNNFEFRDDMPYAGSFVLSGADCSGNQGTFEATWQNGNLIRVCVTPQGGQMTCWTP